MPDTIYDYATKSWPVALGCSPAMRCAPKCWAKRTVNRLAHSPNAKVRAAHEGLVVERPSGGMNWSGVTRLNVDHIADPSGWKKPQIVATGYHGDLFRLPQADIDRVFATMAVCPQHQFLLLTKAVGAMREYFADIQCRQEVVGIRAEYESGLDRYKRGSDETTRCGDDILPRWPFPLRNVWVGVSIMDQKDADCDIPVLSQTPAAHRWLSIEPQVGPVNVRGHLLRYANPGMCASCGEMHGFTRCPNYGDIAREHRTRGGAVCRAFRRAQFDIDWIVQGGESGPDAAPFDLQWARDVRDQCRAAAVPFYFKQTGARPMSQTIDKGVVYAGASPTPPQYRLLLNDRKGADPAEWPEDLRVRELPEVLRAITMQTQEASL